LLGAVEAWPDIRRLLVRRRYARYVDALAGGARVSQEAYAARRVVEEWGVRDLAEAERLYAERYHALLVPFDEATCGPYPELLRPFLGNPGAPPTA
jgi:hypothetical protein